MPLAPRAAPPGLGGGAVRKNEARAVVGKLLGPLASLKRSFRNAWHYFTRCKVPALRRMVPSHTSTRASGNLAGWASERARAPADSLRGGRCHAEGGAASREAAGLVSFKTSPIENNSKPEQALVASISFAPQIVAAKRVKRLKQSVWAAGHLQSLPRPGHRSMVPWFVTLTYAKAGVWKPNHIAEATEAYRRYCKRKNLPCVYLFVAEIQTKRAERTGHHVVHYHLLCWLPPGRRMPQWDRATRSSGREVPPFWSHGDTNTQPARAGVGYLMKYLSKLGELTIFPKGLRMYGMGGLTPDARAIRQWQNLPQWVKNDHGVGDCKRFGRSIVVLASGEILEPMWRRSFTPGGMDLIQLRPMPPKIYDHGPWSTWPRAEHG